MEFYTSVQRIGNFIHYRGYKDGQRIISREMFSPTLYRTATIDNPEWTTIDGTPVVPMVLDDMKTASGLLHEHDDIENVSYFGISNYVAQYIQSHWPDDIQYDPKLIKVANIDIEVESDDGFPEPSVAEKQVQSICLKYFGKPEIRLWVLQSNYDPEKNELGLNPKDIDVIVCDTEEDLLEKFITFWSDKFTSPDIVTGWNVRGFDIPYLVNRTMNLFGPAWIKKFSPWGMVREKNISVHKKQAQVYDLVGIEQLDYYDLFQKFGYLSYGVLESYTLDHVSNVVLGERKLSYEEHGNLFTLYKEDYQKFLDYNMKDVLLVERLDEKMGLIELAQTIAYKGGCNYTESFGTTSLWDTYIYRELTRLKKVVPAKIERPDHPIAGGYVKPPQVGRHSWVVSFDLNSLYPHLMMQYNISPETILHRRTPGITVDECLSLNTGERVHPDAPMAANGVHFRRDFRGVIPDIIDKLYAERKADKQKLLQRTQELDDVRSEMARRKLLTKRSKT